MKEFLQEDDLTEECRDLLSSLPSERGFQFRDNHLYRYEGFWFGAKVLQGVVACQNHFKAQDSDTILATFPKTGTTWLKAMAFALLNRSRFLDLDHHPLLATNPHDLVPHLEVRLYGNVEELPDLSTFSSPRIFATHLPLELLLNSTKDSSCKIVYLCRNPKDTFVSLWHFFNKLRPKELGNIGLEDGFDSFCKGTVGYGPLWDHVLSYWKESLENARRVFFLKYEEIQEQPAVQLRRLAEFLECPFSPAEETRGMADQISRLCSFDRLSNLEVNKTGRLEVLELPNDIFFRKGKVGDWEKFLTPEMAERLDHIIEEKTHDYGFKF